MNKKSIDVKIGDYVMREDGIISLVTDVRPNACNFSFLYGTDSYGDQGTYIGTSRNVKESTEQEYEKQKLKKSM